MQDKLFLLQQDLLSMKDESENFLDTENLN